MQGNNASDWGHLMEQAQSGDKIAFTQLLTEISPIIKARFKRSVPNHIAEDLAQEVLISIYKNLHTFQPGRHFAPWLMTITVNRLKDHFRTAHYKRKFETLDVTDFCPRMIADENSIDERATVLENEMYQLSDKQRQAIELTKINGLSIKEAAEQMKCSEGSIKLLVHRGVTHLKTIFGVK